MSYSVHLFNIEFIINTYNNIHHFYSRRMPYNAAPKFDI